MNLEQRAARYFGSANTADAPVIKLTRRSCFLVMNLRKDSVCLGYYSEKTGEIEAEFWWLTDAKREALVAALGAAVAA